MNGAKHRQTSVALIGCGASGMLFLHALATQRKEQLEKGNEDFVLPRVTCFERANEPGGCWRSPPEDEREFPHNLSCWYEDVWSNICKEGFEFADYTFQDHFETEVPTFLPRRILLDYLTKRTLTVDPDLYQLDPTKKPTADALHEMRFGTLVTSVSFDAETNTFRVSSVPFDPTASNAETPTPTVEHFDYCVWAAGIRGKPRIPRSMLHLFQTGSIFTDPANDEDMEDGEPAPFTGSILHSIQVSNPQFVGAVKGKRIMLIGDSSSAEDLSLQSLKWGAEKVYVLSRSGYRDCVYMGSWPGTKKDDGSFEPKVEVFLAMPYRVVGDGSTVMCCPLIWNPEQEMYEFDDEEDAIVLEKIDTVVFCTGYVPNNDFLSEDLRVEMDSCFWSAPEDFTMKHNALTPDLGEVEPNKELSLSGNIVPGIYRTLLMSNPRMMYLMDLNSEVPLLHLEAMAWLALAFITKVATVPTEEEMDEEIESQMIDEMNIAYLRWSMDRNYFNALDELGDEHWSDDPKDARTVELNKEITDYYTRIVAR